MARYQGTWYELARLPMFFQRACRQSEAHYQRRADGLIDVVNRCRTDAGEWQVARGIAWPQDSAQTDRLWVRFDNLFSRLFPALSKGDYWILFIDPEYQLALVGSPERDYLWLLARQPQVSAGERERLLKIAQARGYVLDQLIWRQ